MDRAAGPGGDAARLAGVCRGAHGHYHAFLQVPHGDLSPGMHDLNAGYASAFNRRHRPCGPLFQGRFKGILVEEQYHYRELSRYVHLNPVRTGLVVAPEVQIEDVVQTVCDAFGVPAEHVRRRGSRRNRARLAAVYLCRSLTRRSVREIGVYFGGISGQAVSNLVGKMAHERQRDKKLNRRLSAIEKTLRQNGK